MDSAIAHFGLGVLAGLLGLGAIILNFYAIYNISKARRNDGAAWGCWGGLLAVWIVSLWAMAELNAVLQVFTVFVILTLIYLSVVSCGSGKGGCCGSCCGSKKYNKNKHGHHRRGGRRHSDSYDDRPGVGYKFGGSSSSSSSSC